MLDLRLMIIWTRVNLAPSYSDNYTFLSLLRAIPRDTKETIYLQNVSSEFEHVTATDADWKVHLTRETEAVKNTLLFFNHIFPNRRINIFFNFVDKILFFIWRQIYKKYDLL